MSRIHQLTHQAPPFYLVIEDGRTITAFPNQLTYEELKLVENGKARLLTRRERRAAFRAQGKPWPVMGGCPVRHPYETRPTNARG